MTVEKKKEQLINILYVGVLGFIAYIFARLIFGVLFPFFIAIVLTIAVQTVARKTAVKLKINVSRMSQILVLSIYLAVAVIIVLLFYFLYNELISLAKMLPKYSSVFMDFIARLGAFLEEKIELFPDKLSATILDFVEGSVQNTVSNLSGFITDVTKEVILKMPSLLLTVIVTVIASRYIAKDYEKLRIFLLESMSTQLSKRIAFIKNLCFGYTFKITKGYIILSFITFCELLASFLLLGKKYALTTALIISLIDLLPVVGCGVVLVPWAIISVALGDYVGAISLFCVYIVILVVRHVSEPKIIGNQIGIHPVIMLISIYCGYKLAGFIGVILFPLIIIITKSWLELKAAEQEIPNN